MRNQWGVDDDNMCLCGWSVRVDKGGKKERMRSWVVDSKQRGVQLESSRVVLSRLIAGVAIQNG